MGECFLEKYCDPKWLADMAAVSKRRWGVFWTLALIFAILGIIAGFTNATLGLGVVGWLLLAITTLVVGMPMWLTWAMARHLLGIEPKKEKE